MPQQTTQANFTFFFLFSAFAFISLLSINNAILGVDAHLVSCTKCVSFWNSLRQDVGCNGNSTICEYLPFNSSECQDMINAVCAAGCENNATECAYVACCAVDFCSGSACNVTNEIY
eukprot:Phypoly_transcript_31411.p1 GENE.Phypoly_transcript_31411~~Phypoly_transcript_31411.p1  ORF type:complete len:117 (+),score=16.04 Phypoly_transcript_31411:50-400(+)